MSFLILKHYLKILNRIEIDLDGIIIEGPLKRKTITWSEINALNLTGKELESFMFTSMPMEALSILNKDRTKEIVFGKYYSNFDRLRTVLHFVNLKMGRNDKITSDCFIQVKRTEPSKSSLPNLRTFGGNHLITFNGLMTYGSTALALWLLAFSNNQMPIILKLFFFSILILFGPGFTDTSCTTFD